MVLSTESTVNSKTDMCVTKKKETTFLKPILLQFSENIRINIINKQKTNHL